MAMRDAEHPAGPPGPAAARFWRVSATDLASDELWDVEYLEFLTDGASVVRHLCSGHAGDGYEPQRAFSDDAGWWGGRPDGPDEGPGAACFLGAEFDAPIVPSAITITHADSPHVARSVVVESSGDGREWTGVAPVELADLAVRGRRSVTVFYAPDVEAAPRWRIVAGGERHDFAWDVLRLRALRRGEDVPAKLDSSGDAGEGFGVDNVGHDGDALWGGRADSDGALQLMLSSHDEADLEIDRLVFDQGADHWVESITVERGMEDGSWSTWRRASGLRPGRNDVLLAVQPRRLAHTLARSAGPTPSKQFGPGEDRRILILIAAYRDPEVAATVAHALAQAAYPEHLRFAICHQHDDATGHLLAPWAADPRFRIDEVPHTESHGCCWARHRTFAHYDDEPYVLQTDSHMRFAARWDVRYIDMLESIDAEAPVLSSYPPRYTVTEDGSIDYDTSAGPQCLYIDEVRPDLTTLQKTRRLDDLSRPQPSPTLAAGQLFARGRFCRDVVYDPDIYFSGEEISLAARAYTKGYDFFAPNENLVWHLYQHDHPKHWEDHRDHSDRHRTATDRLRTLFRGDHTTLGEFGLGNARTLTQFEEYAGISLGARRVAADGSLTIRVDRSVIAPRDDYLVFIVVFFDDEGNEVDRREVRTPDVLELRSDTLSFSGINRRAFRYTVLPVASTGSLGELVVHELSPPHASMPVVER